MDCVDIQQWAFVDGGTRDVAPVSQAIKCNYTNIACLVCQSPDVRRLEAHTFQPRNLADLMSRLMNIVVNETVNNDLQNIDRIKSLLKKDRFNREELNTDLRRYYDLKCVTVIRPPVELDLDDMKFNEADIARTIKFGAEIAQKVLDQPVFKSFADARAETEVPGSYKVCWKT